MSRYFIYNSDDVSTQNPNPVSVYSFDQGESNHGPAIFAGGLSDLPILDVGASAADDFYNGYDIVDETLGETRQIIAYDGTTRECTLDSPFSAGWDVSDTFSIVDSTNWYYIHFQHGASNVNNIYRDYFLVDSVTRNVRSIRSYDGNSKIARLNEFLPTETLQ